MYVWVVRKWYKRDFQLSETGLGGFAAGLASNFSVTSKGVFGATGGGVPADLTYQVEVRLEWKKGKSVKRSLRKQISTTEGDAPNRVKDFALGDSLASRPGGGRASTPTPTATTATESTSSLGDEPTLKDASKDLPALPPPSQATKEMKRKNRLSSLSRSSSRRTSVSDLGGNGNGNGNGNGAGPGDPGEESDPEDSETPWVCTLKVKRLRPRAPLAPLPEIGDESETTLKLKTATLSPTPHHPKVVAMLKVPFPLPDVSLEGDHPSVIKRSVNAVPPLPVDEDEEGAGGMILSAEEIKDVVCSTGFWVVVREGFGGLGRVGRKGDGWRIRA